MSIFTISKLLNISYALFILDTFKVCISVYLTTFNVPNTVHVHIQHIFLPLRILFLQNLLIFFIQFGYKMKVMEMMYDKKIIKC